MKILRLFFFLTLIAVWTSCGERKAADQTMEMDAPGVGAAPDSANQTLDSAMMVKEDSAQQQP